MAEAVQGELNEYKASEEEVMRLKSVMGVSEDDDPDVISGALSDNTAKLTSAIRYVRMPKCVHIINLTEKTPNCWWEANYSLHLTFIPSSCFLNWCVVFVPMTCMKLLHLEDAAFLLTNKISVSIP